jgi:hypothetical protein
VVLGTQLVVKQPIVLIPIIENQYGSLNNLLIFICYTVSQGLHIFYTVTPNSYSHGNKGCIMKVKQLLDGLSNSKHPQPMTPTIRHNLDAIIAYCDKNYNDKGFYGNVALNNQMLRDKKIAELLTPEVLAYLMTNPDSEKEKLTRIVRVGARITEEKMPLEGAIYHGLAKGLAAMKYMTNNERLFDQHKYEENKEKFNTVTMRIVDNLKIATNQQASTLQNISLLPVESLSTCLSLSAASIIAIKADGKSDELLKVNGYTTEIIRKQVGQGFETLCDKVRVKVRKEDENYSISAISSDDFCEKFLQTPDAILNGTVIHVFYDRVHLQAALEQDTTLQFADGAHTYGSLFEIMVNKLAASPDSYPQCALEQFQIRLQLVAADLANRFPEYHQEVKVDVGNEEPTEVEIVSLVDSRRELLGASLADAPELQEIGFDTIYDLLNNYELWTEFSQIDSIDKQINYLAMQVQSLEAVTELAEKFSSSKSLRAGKTMSDKLAGLSELATSQNYTQSPALQLMEWKSCIDTIQSETKVRAKAINQKLKKTSYQGAVETLTAWQSMTSPRSAGNKTAESTATTQWQPASSPSPERCATSASMTATQQFRQAVSDARTPDESMENTYSTSVNGMG